MRRGTHILLILFATCLLAGCGTSEYDKLLDDAIRSMPKSIAQQPVEEEYEEDDGFGDSQGGQTTLGGKKSVLGQAVNAGMRTRALMNLREVMTSIVGYESANGEYPSNIVGDGGTPLLSWRVELLKTLDPLLYNKFKRDEPWDSENNIQLLDRMPDVFDVGYKLEPGFTAIVAITGENTVFSDDNRPKRNVELRDGAGRTGAVVVGGSESAVEWTRPTDLRLDPTDPVRGIAWPDGNYLVGFMDGTAHRASTTDGDVLRGIFGIADGEAYQSSDL